MNILISINSDGEFAFFEDGHRIIRKSEKFDTKKELIASVSLHFHNENNDGIQKTITVCEELIRVLSISEVAPETTCPKCGKHIPSETITQRSGTGHDGPHRGWWNGLCQEQQDHIHRFCEKCGHDWIVIGKALSHANIVEKCNRLDAAIKKHRAQKADDRCIEDDDHLYAALQDGIKCDRRVGDKDAMKSNCARFIDNRCEGGGWPTYAELEQKIAFLQEQLDLQTPIGPNLHAHVDSESVRQK